MDRTSATKSNHNKTNTIRKRKKRRKKDTETLFVDPACINNASVSLTEDEGEYEVASEENAAVYVADSVV